MPGVRKTTGVSARQGVVRDFRSPRPQPAAGPSVERADSTGATERARDLAAALAAVELSEEVRANRVAELKAKIANGTYNPDPREVARKMVERGF